MKPLLVLSSLLVSLTAAGAVIALDAPQFEGTPSSFRAGKGNIAGVWTEGDKLHVRFTTDGTAQRYSGKVCAKDKVTDLELFQVEAGDSVWIGPEGKCVWFKFSTQGFVDGFDVTLPKTLVFLDLRKDRTALGAASVFVGKGNTHPEHSPFVLQRN